jgi:hypothetical protein
MTGEAAGFSCENGYCWVWPGSPAVVPGQPTDEQVSVLCCCPQINWFKHGSALNAMAAFFKSQKSAKA